MCPIVIIYFITAPLKTYKTLTLQPYENHFFYLEVIISSIK